MKEKKERKLNILFVVGAYPPADKEGGPGKMIKALSKSLNDLNCKVKVATTNKNGDEKVSFSDELIFDEYAEVFYGDYKKFILPYFSPSMLKHSYKEIKKTDFLFISSSWNLYGVLSAFFANLWKKPYAVYTHGSYHPVRVKKSRLRKFFWWYIFDKWLYKYAKFVIAMSENERIQVKSYGIESNVIVLPIGVDDNLIHSNKDLIDINRISNNKDYILFLSRISKVKNLEYTFDYFANFLITNDLILLVAGGGDHDYTKEVKSLLDKHPAKEHIKLLGVITEEEKQNLLSNAKFFTLLSKAEGLPQSVLEAMHFGIPCIVSNECNLLDAIHKEVVLSDSDNKTLKLLSELLEDKKKYSSISKRTKDYAKENFDWGPISLRYLEHIKKNI